jgi:serine/threonine-protein kinase
MGGAPITLCDASALEGGYWGSDGTIVFAAELGSNVANPGLHRISANGGQPETLAQPDPEKGEDGYQQPEILPDGKTILFAVYRQGLERGGGDYQTAVRSLETGAQKILLENARSPHYLSTGHLIYQLVPIGTIMAVPFDLSRLEVTGDAIPVLEGVRGVSRVGSADYSISRDGTLVYVSRTDTEEENSLVWVDREGKERLVTSEKNAYLHPRISPDGEQLAITISTSESTLAGNNIWIYDLDDDSFNRLTFEGNNNLPGWSPDSRWVMFRSNRDGHNRSLYRKPADGSGVAQVLFTHDHPVMTNSWSPDGTALLFSAMGVPGTSADLFVFPMEGEEEPKPFIVSPAEEHSAVFSPDGRWMAYIANESGRPQIYVSPYPEPDVKWLVSGEDGGGEPLWSPDGKELFYRIGDKVMAIPVQTRPTFKASTPKVLFEGSYLSSSATIGYQYYDISPDGQRFLMIKEEGEARIHVVLNWFEELKRLVPTDN